MTLPTLVLTGSSHVVSIRNAQAVRRAQARATFDLVDLQLFPRFDPLLKAVDGKVVLHEGIEPALGEIVAAKAPRAIVGSFWGNQHFFMATANFPRRLDFVLPDAPDLPLDPEAEIVPHDALYAYLRSHFGLQDALVAALRRLTDVPLYAVPAPPPILDFAAIASGSSSKALDAMVAEHGAAPAQLRYKFWRLAQAIQQETAAANGLDLLPLPPQTTDAAGFRRPEFHSTDWSHANTAYGELVLQQFDALLAEA